MITKATVKQFAKDLEAYLATAQTQRVVITRNGKPIALVVGMEHKDAEDFGYMTSPEFWRMIDEARSMPGSVSLEEIKAELFPKVTPRKKPKTAGKDSVSS